jgi:hypothetical protein
MKKYFLFAAVLAILASCSSKPQFELDVKIVNQPELINKKLVVSQKVDGVEVYADTVKIKKDELKLKIPYEGQALLFVSVLDTQFREVMLAAEEGIVSLNLGDKVSFGGTPLNDRLQAFNLESDSVSQLFTQMEANYEQLTKQGLATDEASKQYVEGRRKLLKENTDRIIAFTKENVENQVGEYYFIINYYMFPLERKLEMNLFVTEKIKLALNLK